MKQSQGDTPTDISVDHNEKSGDTRSDPPGRELMAPTRIDEVCSARDAALAKMREAVHTINIGISKARSARELAKKAHRGAFFHLEDRREEEHLAKLFREDFDPAKILEVYQKILDGRIWMSLLDRTHIDAIMDATAKNDLHRSLQKDVPEVTFDNVSATFRKLLSESDLLFKRGVATAFSKLDKRFRSHDGFKIGSRIILDRVFDEYGFWRSYGDDRNTLIDVERVFAILDGVTPNPGALVRAIDEARDRQCRRKWEIETAYFRIRAFKNGNVHMWFVRDDLVEKANRLLADYYGDALGDAADKDTSVDELRRRANVPAKDLQFFPTPKDVVDRLMDDVHFADDARILEPSAGTGAIALAAAERGAKVHAIEIHPGRAAELANIRHPRITVTCENFLQVEPGPTYDVVLMNPPFAGIHWMHHVMHAFEFLTPGGILFAILPASAEVGASKSHETFRKWANDVAPAWRSPIFRDLPPESFAEAGTRINTVTLELRKPG